MIDGLEISEVKFSKISRTTTLRFDSDYYKKEYLKIEHFMFTNKDKFVSINDHNLCVDASAFYPSLEPYYNTGTIPFVRVADVKRMIDYDSCVKIPEMDERFNTLYLCNPGDVVLTKGGRVGTAGLITKPSYVTRDLIFINSSMLSRKDYITLYLFFSTNFAYNQMIRSSSMTAQPHLTITLIRDLLIYNYSDEFKQVMEEYYTKMERLNTQSQNCYVQATHILESTLDIQTSTFPISSITTKRISDVSRRWDAEYYQPKYDELFAIFSKHKSKNLGGKDGLVSIKKSIEPGSEAYREEGVPFVRVSDIDKFEISSPEIKLPQDIVPNIENLFPKKDTILLSKDGSVGIAHKVQEDLDVVTSGALLHLTVKDTKEILPDYLTLVLNSSIVQLQAERDCNGAIIQHWKPSDIEKVIIPILDMKQQEEISDKVQESFRLRKESKELLAIAVKAVEMAIETDEKTAITWLREQGV